MRPFASGWWRSRSTDWRLEQEIAEELRFHLACRTDDNVAAGMSERDAERDAEQRLGDFGVVLADGMRMRRGPRRSPRKRAPLDGLLYDLRYGLRLLRASPVTSLVAVLSLALGIGVSTAIFSVMRSTILAPLPFPESDRLVTLYESNEYWGERVPLARAEYVDWREQKQIFADVAGVWDIVGDLEEGDESDRLWIQHVTANLFSMLGLEIVLGRGFTDDDTPETPLAVVLSYGLWQRRFAGDPAVMGRVIRLRNRQYTVVGVLQNDAVIPHLGTQDYGFPAVDGDIDAWISVMQTRQPTDRSSHGLFAIGRLAPGITLAQAQREAAIVGRRLEEANPHTVMRRPGTPEEISAAQSVVLEQLRRDINAPFRLPVMLPFGAAALIILIGCANVANLLLTRATGREREIAVRAALGASQARLFRQLLSENVVLGLLGGAGALVTATWLLDVMPLLAPDGVFQQLTAATHHPGLGFSIRDLEMSASTLAYGVVLSVGTVLLFGTAPAVWGARVDILGSLASSGRVWRRLVAATWLRQAFLVAQIGFSLILLIGAALLVGTVRNIMAVDAGIQYDGLARAVIEIPTSAASRFLRTEQRTFRGQTFPWRVGTPYQGQALQQIRENVEALPGFETVVVFGGFGLTVYGVKGQPLPPTGEMSRALVATVVSGDYIQTVGARLLAGAPVQESDAARESKVVVNEALVRTLDGGVGSAVGKILVDGLGREVEVAAVFADTYQFDNFLDEVRPLILYSAPQQGGRRLYVVARAEFPNLAVLRSSIERAVESVDPKLRVIAFSPLKDLVLMPVAPQRFLMRVLTFFAAAALVLSLIGVYGSFSFFVVQQRRELGIRLALGARRSSIVRIVLGRASAVTGLGITLGLGVALASTRVLSSFLYELEPTDPVTFVGVSVLLFAVALLASYVPARRAARVDPVEVLRTE